MRRAQLLKIFPSILILLALFAPAVVAEETSPQGEQPSEADSAEETSTGEEGVLSGSSNPPEETTQTSSAVAELVQPGLWAFLDPETGELAEAPTASQKLWLEQVGLSSVNKSSEGLQTFELQNGGHGVNLSGRFRSALMVRRKADGTFEMRCSDHPDQPSNHTHTPPAPLAEKAPVQ